MQAFRRGEHGGNAIYRLSIVSLSPSHSLTRAPESLHKSLILFVFSGSISTIPRHMQLALVAFSCVLAVFPRLQLRCRYEAS